MIPMFMVSLAAHFPHIHCVNLNQYTWYDDKCMFYHLKFKDMYNSLRPSEAIWQHRSWSTLPQVMGCCLMATSHYVNQCWLIISDYLAGFHRRAVSQWVPKLFSCVMSLKIILLKLLSHLPEANEWRYNALYRWVSARKTRVSTVREKVREIPVWSKVREFWNGSGNFSNLWKVRELYTCICHCEPWKFESKDRIKWNPCFRISNWRMLGRGYWCTSMQGRRRWSTNHTSTKLTFWMSSSSFEGPSDHMEPQYVFCHIKSILTSWISLSRMIPCCLSRLKNCRLLCALCWAVSWKRTAWMRLPIVLRFLRTKYLITKFVPPKRINIPFSVKEFASELVKSAIFQTSPCNNQHS